MKTSAALSYAVLVVMVIVSLHTLVELWLFVLNSNIEISPLNPVSTEGDGL